MTFLVLAVVLLLDGLFITYSIWFMREMIAEARHVPPYIRTRLAVAPEVRDAFGPLPAGSILYDLGCGDARTLRVIAEGNPDAQCIGIELRRFPYALARYSLWRHPQPNLTVRRASFYGIDLRDATHIYTYLYPEVVDALLPKLEKELVPGAKLVSLELPLSKREATKAIAVKAARPNQLGRTIYVYDF